jgi:hypothetical protein
MPTTQPLPEPRITLPELEQELRRLGAVYGRAISAEAAAAWYQALAFMPRAVLAVAVDRCIFERDRFPAPGTIIAYADAALTEASILPPHPDDAWIQALETSRALAAMPGLGVHDVGLHESIADAIKEIGGAPMLRQASDFDLGQYRRDFARVYSRARAQQLIHAIAASDTANLPAPQRYPMPVLGVDEYAALPAQTSPKRQRGR